MFPGAIATNITENSGLGHPKAGGGDSKLKPLPAGKAAEKIIAAIGKNKFRVTVGQDATFLDWLYRFNPRYATHLILKKMKTLRPATA